MAPSFVTGVGLRTAEPVSNCCSFDELAGRNLGMGVEVGGERVVELPGDGNRALSPVIDV